MSAPTPYAIIRLAKVLHDTYRAAFIALHGGRGSFMGVGRVGANKGCRNEHDHSWSSCHKKAYFLRRATRVLREGRL